MVAAIIRLTAAAVLLLALANAGQGVWLALRLARVAHTRVPQLGARMWLPLFASCADVRDWLAAWRALLTHEDDSLVALRLEARTVVARYVSLVVGSNTWALAVWTLLLPSAA